VGMGQQAGRLEVSEDPAHRGAADGQRVTGNKRLRADRHGGGDVFLDDGPEDRLRSGVQRARGADSTRQGGAFFQLGEPF